MKALLYFTTLSIPFVGMGQNLIPNPSFETWDCVTHAGTPYFFGAESWYNCNSATPDMYGISESDSCDIGSIYDPDWSIYGEWQFPKDGEYMTALWAGDGEFCTRDYIQCELNEPLSAGHRYCFEMYISLNNRVSLATNCFGAFFSSLPIVDFDSPCWFDLEPQVENPPGVVLSDTLNWTLISGSFIAEGSELYLTIGNLRENSSCNWILVEGNKDWPVAKYFVDDLSLVDCTPVGTEEPIIHEMKVFPNPANTTLNFQVNRKGLIRMYDATGVLVLEHNLDQGLTMVNIDFLPSGLYNCLVFGPNGVTPTSLCIE